jgi:hypothetical protein
VGVLVQQKPQHHMKWLALVVLALAMGALVAWRMTWTRVKRSG